MSQSKVIRAWKDPAYRNSLSSAEQADLPANPAGAIEIPETELGQTAGGKAPHTLADECGLHISPAHCPGRVRLHSAFRYRSAETAGRPIH